MLALTKFGHPNWGTPNYGTISYKSITSYPCVGHVTLVAKCCIAFGCCSVTQLCPTICNPMDCSMPGFPVLHHLPAFVQTHVHWVSDTTQSSHPLSPSPPAFSLSQHQGLFESALCIRWPKYWSFSFSISPSNEFSGLISFRIDSLGLISLQFKGLPRVFSNTTVRKHQFFSAQQELP